MMMGKIVATFLSLCLTLFTFSACSWVDDDTSDCPIGCWVQLSYTYNMLDAEAVYTQVKDATLFVLDAEGNEVVRQEVDSLTLSQNAYKIQVPSLPEGEYTYLVWAGLESPCYQYSGTSLSLVRNDAGENSERLPSLFHGRRTVTVTGDYQVDTLSLTKDTNILSCIVQSQSGDALNSEDFRFELVSKNGTLDNWNVPVSQDDTYYLPYMQEAENLEDFQVVHAGMNTLRLMEEDNTRLRLIYVPGGYELFDIPLTQYLLLSRKVEAKVYPPQEYLDRQDRYDLIFFLNSTDNPEKPYVCMLFKVNGWIVRLNDTVLDRS